MIKWKTSSYGNRIEPVEVTKETACFVWMLGKPTERDRSPEPRQESKEGFFDTWDEAHYYIADMAARKVEETLNYLGAALENQAEIAAMTKPEGVE
jgi:hypothetical protein